MSQRLQQFREKLFQGNRSGLFIIIFIVSALFTSMWAIGMPVSTMADEPAHIVKAAGVVRGQMYGEKIDGDDVPGRVFNIPEAIANVDGISCNSFQVEVPVSKCIYGYSGTGQQLVAAHSTAGAYNPLYYFLVGWPSLLSASYDGLILVRIVSGLLISLFVAATVWSASWVRNSRIPMFVSLTCLSPVFWGFGGAINPQSAESAMIAGFTMSLYVLLNETLNKSPKICIALVLLFSGLLGVNMRPISWFLFGLAAVVVFIFSGWKKILGFFKNIYYSTITAVILVSAGVSLCLNVIFNYSDPALKLIGEGFGFVGMFFYMLQNTGGFMRQMFTALGWGDISDVNTFVIYGTLFIVIVFTAFIVRTKDKLSLASLTVALAMFLFVPTILQSAYIHTAGYIWQGRYNYPLYILLVFIAALRLAKSNLNMSSLYLNKVFGFVLFLFGLAQIASFHEAMRREYIGLGFSLGIKPMLHAQQIGFPYTPPGLNILAIDFIFIVVTLIFIFVTATVTSNKITANPSVNNTEVKFTVGK